MGFTCDSLKCCILTGEPVFEHQTQLIAQTLGVSTLIEYGSIECGIIGGQWPDQTLRVRDDHCFVETLPRDDGQHELIVTVLNNAAFPLMRYAIGDLTGSRATTG